MAKMGQPEQKKTLSLTLEMGSSGIIRVVNDGKYMVQNNGCYVHVCTFTQNECFQK